VLSHLLGNAIQFTREGGSVAVAVAAAPGAWAVSVTDTGPGIQEAQIGRLFEPFNRGTLDTNPDAHDCSGTRGPAEGLGIGLALARWLVDTMGGRIDVHSTLGVGSTFTVTLPAAEALATRPQKAAA